MAKKEWDMSSEEIADEIQREGLKENIPYYASMIEDYADKLMDAQLQALKGESANIRKIRNYFGESDLTPFEHWAYDELNKVLNLITNLEDK